MAIKPSPYNEGIIDKRSNYQVLVVGVIYQAYHTKSVLTYSWQFFFLVLHYLFTISEGKNCRFFYSCSFYVLFCIMSHVEKIKIHLCFWNGRCAGHSMTTWSTGLHYVKIILDIFWHLRLISSGVGCIVIFRCLVVILTDFC